MNKAIRARKTNAKSRNIAIIFAGGRGERMGRPDGPKQFIKVKDKPIIAWTLEIF